MFMITNHGKKFIDGFANIPKDHQISILVCYLARQEQLVNNFDKAYNENLSKVFVFSIDVCEKFSIGSGDINETRAALSTIESITPDTNDYGDIEGVLAQNAFISLSYGIEFICNLTQDDFLNAIEKVLESVDVLSYSKDENYDEEKEIGREIKVLESMLCALQNEKSITSHVLDVLKEIAKNNPINF